MGGAPPSSPQGLSPGNLQSLTLVGSGNVCVWEGGGGGRERISACPAWKTRRFQRPDSARLTFGLDPQRGAHTADSRPERWKEIISGDI